jgi:hypothetical protein
MSTTFTNLFSMFIAANKHAKENQVTLILDYYNNNYEKFGFYDKINSIGFYILENDWTETVNLIPDGYVKLKASLSKIYDDWYQINNLAKKIPNLEDNVLIIFKDLEYFTIKAKKLKEFL